MFRFRTSLVFVLSMVFVSAVFAAVPRLVNFQGVLRAPDGSPVPDGAVTVTFRIYNASSGGNMLWTETRPVATSGGLFSLLLGSVNPIPDSAFKDSDRWLGIQVSPDPEMTPRQRLVSVPYGYRVSSLEGAAGAPINSVDGASGGTISGDVFIIGRAAIGSGHIISGQFAFAAGSTNTASGSSSAVGGGSFNFATGDHSIVGGGSTNTAGNGLATVGGGGDNFATGFGSTVSGGIGSIASGGLATAAGGQNNEALGNYSFAAGRRARAQHWGAFAWADGNDFDFPSTAINQFGARCIGGARFISAIDGSGNPTAGVTLAPGGGSWSSLSDRNFKANFQPVEGAELLTKLGQLPISTWNYTAQDVSIRHIGPTAQDFYSAFGVGEDDRHITTIDADGVALAAIQALYRTNREQEAQLRELKGELKELQNLIQKLLLTSEENLVSGKEVGPGK